MKTNKINLHHIEIEIVDCSKHGVTLDSYFFTSERQFVKVVGGCLKKKKGDVIYIDAKTTNIS